MSQSNEINELAQALVFAQSEITGAIKDSTNPFFKSKYADLESVWSAARDPLTKNGLCVVQSTDVRDGETGVVTILMHRSGQWISGFYPIRAMLSPVKREKEIGPSKEGHDSRYEVTPQAAGSAMTYARRYALAAMVGIVQVDDDGEGAMNRDKTSSGIKPGVPGPQDGHTHDKPGMIYYGYYQRKMPHEVDRDKLEIERDRLGAIVGNPEAARAHRVIEEYLQFTESVPGWDEVHPPSVPLSAIIAAPNHPQQTPVNTEYGEYTVLFGKKYKDRKVKDIVRNEIEGYVKYLEQSAATDGKPLSKDAAELRFAVGRYYGTI